MPHRVASKSSAPETRRAPMPAYAPQLATLVDEPPSGPPWVHELKYDGYRIGCSVVRGRVRLTSRNGKDWTHAFPEVTAAAAELPVRDALFDGEVAMVDARGRTSFQALQNAFTGGERQGLTYFVFDLLYLNGRDTRPLPLRARKALLRALIPPSGPIKYADDLAAEGPVVLDQACRLGAEGIVSKRADRPYRAGRNANWLKSKCLLRQEFVIGGYTDPEGSRSGVGALLVGVREHGRLVFAGKVGTGRGFTATYLRKLRTRLARLDQSTSPFTRVPPARYRRGVHWVRPVLIAEVSFTEWTTDGIIRHASMQGLRADKDAAEITRERPKKRERAATRERAEERPKARRTRGPAAKRAPPSPV